jgi:peptide/nickel transport system permease protein
MPVLTLCCVIVAQMTRMTRAAVIDQLRSSYAEMALLKGVKRTRIVLRHAAQRHRPDRQCRRAEPVLPAGWVIIVESIFNYPGIATLMIDAVTTRDMPLVQACSMIFCAGYLLLVLAADVLAIVSNPRLKTDESPPRFPGTEAGAPVALAAAATAPASACAAIRPWPGSAW